MSASVDDPASDQSPQDRERLHKKGVFLRRCAILSPLLGIAGSFLTIVLILSLTRDMSLDGTWKTFFYFLPLGIGFGCGVYLYHQSKKCFALSAQETLAIDLRPPVIYLRSFKDDRDTAAANFKQHFPLWRLLHPIKLWGSVLNFFDNRTEEEMLAKVLSQVGPVVGIGRPGEKLPQLGAARVYVGDDEWQKTVRDFLSQAGLVVLRLGKTPGFFWEVEQSAGRMDPARLILLVPLSSRKYRDFCDRAAPHFSKGLPAYNCSRFRRIFGANLLGDLKAMIYFEPDWTPVFVDLARVRSPWRHKLRMAGRRDLLNAYDWAMQPVYRQLGVEWKAPSFGPARIGVVLFKSIPVLFLIGMTIILLTQR